MEPPTAAYLLMTGSRKHDASTAHIIRAGLIEAGQHLGRDTVLIHGGQGRRRPDGIPVTGADVIAAHIWTSWADADGQPLPVEEYPANWSGPCVPDCKPGHRQRYPHGSGDYCPAAGDRRNKAMVALVAGLFEVGHRVLCVGFPYPGQKQGGTFNCLRDWRAVRPALPHPWVRADPNVEAGRMSAYGVAACGYCEAVVYALRQNPGNVPILLDSTDHPDGQWVPQPDGISCSRAQPGESAHREHDCLRDQIPLLDGWDLPEDPDEGGPLVFSHDVSVTATTADGEPVL